VRPEDAIAKVFKICHCPNSVKLIYCVQIRTNAFVQISAPNAQFCHSSVTIQGTHGRS